MENFATVIDALAATFATDVDLPECLHLEGKELFSIQVKEGKKVVGQRFIEGVPQADADLSKYFIALLPAATWAGHSEMIVALKKATEKAQGVTREMILTKLAEIETGIKAYWEKKGASKAQQVTSWKIRLAQIKELWGRTCSEKVIESLGQFVIALQEASPEVAGIVLERMEKMREKTAEVNEEEIF